MFQRLRHFIADQRAAAHMTAKERLVCRTFDIPYRMGAAPGLYANVAQDLEAQRRAVFGFGAFPDQDRDDSGRFESAPTRARFLCPATSDVGPFNGRTMRRTCMEPLPCTLHRIDTPQVGAVLYGETYLEGVRD